MLIPRAALLAGAVDLGVVGELGGEGGPGGGVEVGGFEDVGFGVGAGVGLEEVEDGGQGIGFFGGGLFGEKAFEGGLGRLRLMMDWAGLGFLFAGTAAFGYGGFFGGAQGADALEEDRGRLVVGVLGHELAAEGFGEDGLV